LQSYVHQEVNESQNTTIGAEFMTKNV
jgi:hypothetical protein